MLEMPTSSQEIKQTQVRLVSKGHQRFVGEPNWRLCSELVGDPKPHRVEDGFRVEIASRKRNRAGVGVRITKICVAVFKSANDMIGQGGIDAEASRPPGFSIVDGLFVYSRSSVRKALLDVGNRKAGSAVDKEPIDGKTKYGSK